MFIFQVFLGPNGEVEEYAVVSIQADAAISSDLLLDQSEEHLFIMTSTMLQKRPVAECHEHLDCQACLSAHDPYCGWCVLEGRCGQQAQCSRGAQAGQWLWSFDMEQKCLTIQSLSPSNISRQEKRSISLSVLGLAVLEENKSYSCFFHDSESPATVTDVGVTCLSPDPHRVLTGPPGQGEFQGGQMVCLFDQFSLVCLFLSHPLPHVFPLYPHPSTTQFKLPTPAPPTTVSPTTVPPTTTTTAPPTTTTATIATTTSIKPPTTIATALEPMTTTLSTTTTPEPTTLPNPAMPTETPTTAMQTEAPTILPPTTLAKATTPIPETTTSEAEEQTTAEELVAEAESETVGPVVTPGNVELAAETEVATVMTKDGQPSDDLATLIPLAFPPETSPLEVVTAPPPQELDKALSLAEPPMEVQPTPVSYPFPAPFPLGEPVDSDLTFHLDLTEAPSPLPLDHLHPLPTDAEGQGAEPEVLLWPREEVEEEAEDMAVENDTSTTFSATSVLSGDGEAADHFLSGSAYPQLLDADSELDYQYDSSDTFLPGDSGSYVSWGSSACPCVEKVQGSHLLPVRVARKITLFARNLHLYQDTDLDYECVLVIEGQTVVVDAYVEMDEMNPSLFDITCQLHQYSYSAPVDEYNAMVYVKRRDTFHVDSSHDLYGESQTHSAGEQLLPAQTAVLLLSAITMFFF
ncbi:unnamed protein product [Oncorhynchus mykiss]|uniref:PSI domain-containing protein n=1 Tax=Oncorhynchus mykiss TaxID=8022 RepID=A0A060WYK4_ONCMY|nr:unnamed protein product [Oncorhynchus mykiss]